MTVAIRPLIMCGGSGTRLWPVSREALPKQFAPLVGDRSTFQATIERVADRSLFGKPLIVANHAHRFMIERQLREIGIEADLLLEPFGRDSGPAIAAGAAFIAETNPETPVLVLAADHLVRDTAGFRATVAAGLPAALAGRIVTHCVVPTGPETGYGYIEAGEAIGEHARIVKRFVEKPDARTAADYVLKGFFWNSGNFLFKAEVLLSEYETFEPETIGAVREALARRSTDLGAPVLDADAFSKTVRRSIDYAVMNHTRLAAMVKATFDWSDIGSWEALSLVTPANDQGNVTNGRTKMLDAKNCFVSTSGQLTALIGVENLIVVATQDAILVTSKQRSGDVKTLVETMRQDGVSEATEHPRVHRPWGWFQTLDLGQRFRVKRIVVYPAGRLSLQMHHHRAEHWVVVSGTARITVGEDEKVLTENQSVYISLGQVHRLENPGLIDLELIEVQTGSYLGEDDIVRLEDVYNRVSSIEA